MLSYLDADARAEQEPSRELAGQLGRAGEMAATLGEVALARAAFERAAAVWRSLGGSREEEMALSRAREALGALEQNLPEELRGAFCEHPRNRFLNGGW